ncbi:MAG: hypothetical protein LC793_13780 [Thermomicrobia bacterium]|nr:hypothetical protein [Thermomicrobia bacterium]
MRQRYEREVQGVAGTVVGATLVTGAVATALWLCAVGLERAPQAARSAPLAAAAAPPSAMRRTLRRPYPRGTSGDRCSSRIAHYSFRSVGD